MSQAAPRRTEVRGKEDQDHRPREPRWRASGCLLAEGPGLGLGQVQALGLLTHGACACL